MSDSARSAVMTTFTSTLNTIGVREALAYLLRLTDYRFIGIFRFENGMADAAIHFDRENPSQRFATEVPDSATYCCYVRDSRGAFMTADAMTDDRTEGHPARRSVPAYCGVPILTPEGELLGTLCHYDFIPRDPSQVDLPLMMEVSSALAYGHHVPPYPTPEMKAAA